MAFALDLNEKSSVEVVVHKDSCLDMTKEEYSEYLKNVTDITRLKFVEGKSFEDTTRFVMRKVIPFKATQRVIDQQMSADSEGKAKMSLKFILEEVRAALVDIKNPEGEMNPLVFKRSSDGMASEQMVVGFYHAGVLTDLLNGRQNSLEKNNTDDDSKKN